MLDIVLLGCGGTVPLKNRWLTACYLRCNGRAVLIDCGEGTQIAVKEAGVSLFAIDTICLTHYHADHVSGLPGLLLSMGNEGRIAPLAIYGPRGLQRIIEGLRVIAPELPFSLELHEFTQQQENFIAGDLHFTAFGVQHTLPCYGYRVHLPRAGKFDPVRAEALGLEKKYWGRLQKGEIVELDGKTYTPDMVMGGARKGIKLTYCTDTRPTESIVAHAENADLFICEGMYGEPEKKAKAKEYKHMTFYEAAELAKKAQVEEMWLTHYSPSLIRPEEYMKDVKAIFPNSKAAKDGMSVELKFEEV